MFPLTQRDQVGMGLFLDILMPQTTEGIGIFIIFLLHKCIYNSDILVSCHHHHFTNKTVLLLVCKNYFCWSNVSVFAS